MAGRRAAAAAAAGTDAAAALPQPLRRRTRAAQQLAGFTIECVRPSATDPRIRRFDSASYALFNPNAKPNGQLLLFLPGTGASHPGQKRFLRGGRRRLPRYFSRIQRRHLGRGLLSKETKPGVLGSVSPDAHLRERDVGGRRHRQHAGGIDRQSARQAIAISRSQSSRKRLGKLYRERRAKLATHRRIRAVARRGHGRLHRQGTRGRAGHSVFQPLGLRRAKRATRSGALARLPEQDAARSMVRRISRAREYGRPPRAVLCGLKIPRDHIRVFNRTCRQGIDQKAAIRFTARASSIRPTPSSGHSFCRLQCRSGLR